MRFTPRKAHWLIALTTFAWLGTASLHASPLAFEENRGQTDPRVRYLARGQSYTLFLTPVEAVLSLRGSALRIRWTGAAPAPRMTAEGRLPGVTHYLTGRDPSGWRKDIPSWTRIQYEEVWPGIGLAFYGNPLQLEHDVVVAPGADPGQARLAFEGAEELRIDPAGDLVIRVGGEEVRLRRPVSYQEVDGARREIESGWRLLPSRREAGFRVAAYDRTRPLVIDPVLEHSTYLGGSLDERITDLAIDELGDVYVAGTTISPDFPEIGALPTPSTEPPARGNAVISRFDSDGTLVFSTYLGGEGGDQALGLDASHGLVAVTGLTLSTDFPYFGANIPISGTNYYFGFLTLLDTDGSSILWSALIGGEGHNEPSDAAIAGGYVYVTGWTDACDFPFFNGLPTPSPCEPFSFFSQAFVMKVSLDGQEVPWSSSLGERGDKLHRIAVDSQGSAVVAGDGLVVKLGAAGSSVIYSVPLGDSLGGLALDAADNAYVTGSVGDDSLPTVRPLQPGRAGDTDAFVARLTPAGAIDFSTYLGGSGPDFGRAIDVDAAGAVYAAGHTQSADFPVVRPVQAACSAGCSEAFLTKIDPSGAALSYSTYFGGSGGDAATGVGVDPEGAAWIAGDTSSADFPVVDGAFPALRGDSDGFLAKITDANQPPECSAATASPSMLWPPNGRMVPATIGGVTDPDGDPVAISVTAIRQDEPLSRKSQSDATGLGTSRPQVRASRDGNGDGRVYHITFTATDRAGAACSGTVTVCVPRDRGKNPTCGDGGPTVTSTE